MACAPVATTLALALSVLALLAAAADPAESCSAGSPGCDAAKQEADDDSDAMRVSLLQHRGSLGEAQAQCTDGWPQCAQWNNDNRAKCECAGNGYIYNRGRYSGNSVCGSNCWCCKSGGRYDPRRRRGGGGGNYKIFSGYSCQSGYQPIRSQNECQQAAQQVTNNNLHVDTNVPSSSQNPQYCYIYGSYGSFSNLYFNSGGTTHGSWEKRNVICKQGYSSLAQESSQEGEEEEEGAALPDKQSELLAELDSSGAALDGAVQNEGEEELKSQRASLLAELQDIEAELAGMGEDSAEMGEELLEDEAEALVQKYETDKVALQKDIKVIPGYSCSQGYEHITSQYECNQAAAAVGLAYLKASNQVTSASGNPRYCYLYGHKGSWKNLYWNPQGATHGSWPDRNVICKKMQPPSWCQANCHKYTCQAWVAEGYSCNKLETSMGCDCSGCCRGA